MRRIFGTVILIGIVTLTINTNCYVMAGEGMSNQKIQRIAEENQARLREAKVEEEQKYLIEVTQADIDLMARVVMSEASILCDDAKQAIAQTIVNRVRDTEGEFRNLNTIEEVVYQINQYSTQDNGEPNEECYRAVENALMYEAFPVDMYYFRTDYFHSFGFPYMKIENTYFSTKGENNAWED